MRIWDIQVGHLCDQHLLGEHRELHAIWNILVDDKDGYSNHPETKRWRGRLNLLWNRHRRQIQEMRRRGMNHNSDLDDVYAMHDTATHKPLVDPIPTQISLLRGKDCSCFNDSNRKDCVEVVV